MPSDSGKESRQEANYLALGMILGGVITGYVLFFKRPRELCVDRGARVGHPFVMALLKERGE